ncbi:C13 family peptidase [Stutzerimonas azotifigens]|uniref:C13 family peptidase n=1 Tax=Stutzerimonas azotifigens TaxID=291995 RepID=UPI00040DEC9A|nr:C13 family peptidase [Stutzerimonas azotifigens]
MRSLFPLALTCLLAACGDGTPVPPSDALLADGGRYRGPLVDGLMHGEGRLEQADGSWYEGRFERGLRDGQGRWQAANGDRYTGRFRAGLFHGKGRLDYAAGGYYEGDFTQGRMQGQGEFSQDGVHYQGGFANDLYEGEGTLRYDDETYRGTFRAGQLQGHGEYRHADGSRYEGEFRDGDFDGQGRYQDGVGNRWSGTFAQGQLSGPGEYLGVDGTHYQGDFQGWRYHGQGRLSQPDGSRYSGAFARDRFAGEGTLTLADGSTQRGTWRDGRRVADAAGQRLPDPLEEALLAQGRLLDEALAAVPPSTEAPELYSLTFAGDGSQSVFRREADYVTGLLAERFAAHGQITLVNHRDSATERPLATASNLARAIGTLARRSGPEDLIFLYFTSHGSADHALALQQPRLSLGDLPATELAQLLAPLRERDKVVVISACYSGGFIEPLKNERTLIMTAARADRVSFGCSEQSDFTYFGRALFAEALQRTDDLAQAFTLAQARVAEWEQADDYQASEPQLWAPEQVLARWRALPGQPD